jgi:hypothetical protein
MSRTIGRAAAGLVLVAALAACHSGKSGAPASSASGSAAASSVATGSGTATVKVGATNRKFNVTCTRSVRATQATGNEGADAVTLTVAGTPLSVVLVSHDGTGATTIYQAIAGLVDDAGKKVGAVSVTGSANTFNGTGTFVLTKLDRSGKRVKLVAGSSQPGTFQLACSGGFAAAPTPSGPTSAPKKSPSGSVKPSGTKTS